MIPNKETLGQRIERLRKERGLTQVRLGELVSLRAQNIHQIETGTIPHVGGYLKEFATALQVTEDYLLKGDSPEEVERRRIADFARGHGESAAEVLRFVEFTVSGSRYRNFSEEDLLQLLSEFRTKRPNRELEDEIELFGLKVDDD